MIPIIRHSGKSKTIATVKRLVVARGGDRGRDEKQREFLGQ